MTNVTVNDLRGLLEVIGMAETSLESGIEDEDLVKMIRGASRCYPWILKEIRRREELKLFRKVLRYRTL